MGKRRPVRITLTGEKYPVKKIRVKCPNCGMFSCLFRPRRIGHRLTTPYQNENV
ncbi:hypothetical protein AZA_32411 [Nitrospirillum viridazoti Y2]|nr:hypothetical protein AZA_32411 [Nitrospirillum amazonense Y2]